MILDGSGQEQVSRIEMDMPTAPKLTFSDDLVESARAPVAHSGSSSQHAESTIANTDLAAKVTPEVVVTKDNPTLSGWVVQVGAFTEQEKAQVLLTKLQAASFDAFIEIGNKQGKNYYRVKAGPELDQDKALELQQQIAKKMSIESGFVTRHPNVSTN